MVLVLPVYEQEQPGVLYNTAAVVDSDGRYLGKYRKHHIPHLDRFWEKFYFRPGNLGYPVFDTAVGKIGVYICYDRHFLRAGATTDWPEQSSSLIRRPPNLVFPTGFGNFEQRRGGGEPVLRRRQQSGRRRKR